MAVCGGCGTETARVRSTLRGEVFVDECPSCQPQSFEKATDPSDKRVWMGWERDPKRYKKTDDGYQATDENLQDLENWALQREDPTDADRNEVALEKRRQYCAQFRKAETPEEAQRNAERTRELIRRWESEAALENMGIVLPEG